MRKILWLGFALYFVALVLAAAAMAATVTSRNGKTAHVSSAFAPHLQCFIRKLDAAGYRIDFMTGYASRSNASAHPTGNAADINQTGFGRMTRRFPHGYAAMAKACGVYDGARFGDIGHVEMPNKYGYVNLGGYHARHHHGGSIARHHHRR